MRALVGALVGLVVAAAVVAGIGIAVRGSYWSVIPAGLAAGVIMRAMAKGAGSSYLTGGLATVATVLAAASGPLITTEWFRNQTNRLQPTIAQTESADDPADQAAGESEATPDTAELAEREAPPTRRISLSESMTLGPPPDGAASAQGFGTGEITCLVVGCLAAYLLGGSGAAAATVSEADSEAAGEAPTGEDPGPTGQPA